MASNKLVSIVAADDHEASAPSYPLLSSPALPATVPDLALQTRSDQDLANGPAGQVGYRSYPWPEGILNFECVNFEFG